MQITMSTLTAILADTVIYYEWKSSGTPEDSS